MKTPQEFRDFFEAIPEEKWATNDYVKPDGTMCAMGHLGCRRRSSVFGAALFISQQAHDFEHLIYRSMLLDGKGASDINDGRAIELFPQFTPKARILALCDELIAKGISA